MAAPSGLRPPSLSRPFTLVRSDDEVDNPPVPAFPEIRSGWAGVALDILRGVGINDMVFDDQLADEWCYILYWSHEAGGHALMFDTTLSQLTRFLGVSMCREVSWLCKGKEHVKPNGLESSSQIRTLTVPVFVPLKPDNSPDGSYLELLWQRLVNIHNISRTVQEIVSVWASLEYDENIDIGLSIEDRKRLEKVFVAKYSEEIPDFAPLYYKFKRVASNLGDISAMNIAHYALSTFVPSLAFDITLTQADKLAGLRRLPAPKRNIENYIFRRVIHTLSDGNDTVFNYLFDGGTRSIEKIDAFLKHIVHKPHSLFNYEPFCDLFELGFVLAAQSGHYSVDLGDVGEYVKSAVDEVEPIEFYFNKDKLYIPNIHAYLNGKFGELFKSLFFYEALRQQVTQGIGVICPFWDPQAQQCCFEMRQQLENLLTHTVRRDGNKKKWCGKGCIEDFRP